MCWSIMRTGIVLFLAVLPEYVVAKDDFQSFAGKWSFESFRHETFLPESENVNDEVDLAIPWIQKSELDLNVDSTAKTVSGTLSIGNSKLLINGDVEADSTIGKPCISAIAHLTAAKTARAVTYRFKGYLVSTEHPVIVGSVVLYNGDDLGLDPQPSGTTGAFSAIKQFPKATRPPHDR
jgi:hypothetical protein